MLNDYELEHNDWEGEYASLDMLTSNIISYYNVDS